MNKSELSDNIILQMIISFKKNVIPNINIDNSYPLATIVKYHYIYNDIKNYSIRESKLFCDTLISIGIIQENKNPSNNSQKYYFIKDISIFNNNELLLAFKNLTLYNNIIRIKKLKNIYNG